ncbi:MAG: hypothetical protein ACRDSP_22810 [Pseudonocardiaceae bacterium]
MEGNRQSIFWQDFTVQFTIDSGEETYFTLGNPPLALEEPFPSLFWKRSSSNYGLTAAVWIGTIPDASLRVKALADATDGKQLIVDRDCIVVAMRQVIELGGSEPGDSDGVTFLS